jgi:hypothetical protein
MANQCNLGAFASEALRALLLCGKAKENTQNFVLAKANLMMEKAMEILLGIGSNGQTFKGAQSWSM